MNGSCFFVISGDFVGRKRIHFIFTVRVQTELVILGLFLRLPQFAGVQNLIYYVVKNSLKLASDGVSNQIEESKTSLSHLVILLIHQNLVDSLHNRHNVSIVKKLAILVFRFAECISYFTQDV